MEDWKEADDIEDSAFVPDPKTRALILESLNAEPSSEANDTPPDVLELADSLIQNCLISNPNNNSTKDSDNTTNIYPEVLLQKAENANRYYASFQRFQRQFINEDEDSINKAVRWTSKSKIQQTSKKIIQEWIIAEQKGRTIDSENDVKKLQPANTLFSWSSGDSYIQERRRQLQERKRKAMNEKVPAATDPSSSEDKSRKHSTTDKDDHSETKHHHTKQHIRKRESILANLNRTIELESTKFIHARIQKIKKHHNEQISKKIHERKRRDHELHLNRLKLKEEEYERSLQSVSNQKQGGFFGTIFGFNQNGKKENELVDSNSSTRAAELPSSTAPSTPTTLTATESSESLSSSAMTTGTHKTNTSSSKNKRFSFLPGTAKWNSAEGNEKSKKQNQDDGLKDVSESNSQPQVAHKEEGKSDSEKDIRSVDHFNIAELDSSSRTHTPKLPAATPAAATSAMPSAILTPKILSPKILTPTKRAFTLDPPVTSKSQNQTGFTNLSGPSVLDDDDFSDFTSAVPQSKAHSSVPKQQSTAGHRFIPLEKAGNSHSINNDLLDLFDNDVSKTNTKTSKTNPPIEDLLSL